MPRIQPVNPNAADSAAAELLNSVQRKLGAVPNLVAMRRLSGSEGVLEKSRYPSAV